MNQPAQNSTRATAPPLDPLAHPLRDAFAYIFRPEDAAALAGGVALAGSLLTEGEKRSPASSPAAARRATGSRSSPSPVTSTSPVSCWSSCFKVPT